MEGTRGAAIGSLRRPVGSRPCHSRRIAGSDAERAGRHAGLSVPRGTRPISGRFHHERRLAHGTPRAAAWIHRRGHGGSSASASAPKAQGAVDARAELRRRAHAIHVKQTPIRDAGSPSLTIWVLEDRAWRSALRTASCRVSHGTHAGSRDTGCGVPSSPQAETHTFGCCIAEGLTERPNLGGRDAAGTPLDAHGCFT